MRPQDNCSSLINVTTLNSRNLDIFWNLVTIYDNIYVYVFAYAFATLESMLRAKILNTFNDTSVSFINCDSPGQVQNTSIWDIRSVSISFDKSSL